MRVKRKNRKKKRHGAIGRKWRRKDCPEFACGDIDPHGLLKVVRDLGTRGRNRYISALCLCCNAVVEVQLGHFRDGKASCPTRSNAQRRSFMEHKEHIAKVKLIGRILDGGKVPDATVKTAVEYATRYIGDTELQSGNAAKSSPSLAARDLRRCNELVSKHSAPAIPTAAPRHQPTCPPAPEKPKPAARVFTAEEVLDFANMKLISPEDFQRLLKIGQWTAAGRAAFIAGQAQTVARVLSALKPYLDVNYGIVTFSRVPDSKRTISGKPVRELMEAQELIDSKLNLTDKGKVWLSAVEAAM
jgi:hypothetical protein